MFLFFEKLCVIITTFNVWGFSSVSQHPLNPQAERAALLEELATLRQRKEQLKTEIDKYRECDPDVVEEMRKLCVV